MSTMDEITILKLGAWERWDNFFPQAKKTQSPIETRQELLTSHPGLGSRAAATIELAFPYAKEDHNISQTEYIINVKPTKSW
jgi:transposase